MSTTNETEQLNANIASAIREFGRNLGNAVERGRRTCVHCRHFDEASEVCRLASQRPPARVIAFGCPQFDPDVPF